MSIEEIVHTCSHEKVAHAAVVSLGFNFASRVCRVAESQGVTMGHFVARIVREFGEAADACERRAVSQAMTKADQPLLCGLRFILEDRLKLAQTDIGPQWPIGPLPCSMPADLAVPHAG